jgi:hypothetical protein
MAREKTVETNAWKSRAALTAAVLLALWGAVEHYTVENVRSAQEKDPYSVDMRVQRLAGVIAAVARDAVVGYLTNLAPGSVGASASFNAARYALAPRLLVQSTSQDWVLGDFSSPQDYAAIGAQHGLQVVQDFGNGAVLYRRRAR